MLLLHAADVLLLYAAPSHCFYQFFYLVLGPLGEVLVRQRLETQRGKGRWARTPLQVCRVISHQQMSDVNMTSMSGLAGQAQGFEKGEGSEGWTDRPRPMSSLVFFCTMWVCMWNQVDAWRNNHRLMWEDPPASSAQRLK
jgi:hypothetical protein